MCDRELEPVMNVKKTVDLGHSKGHDMQPVDLGCGGDHDKQPVDLGCGGVHDDKPPQSQKMTGDDDDVEYALCENVCHMRHQGGEWQPANSDFCYMHKEDLKECE